MRDIKYISEILKNIRLPYFTDINISEMMDTLVTPSTTRSAIKNIKFFFSTIFFHNYDVEKKGNGEQLFLFSLSYLTRYDHLVKIEKVKDCSTNYTFFKGNKRFNFSAIRLKLIPNIFVWTKRLVNCEIDIDCAFFLSIVLYDILYSDYFITTFIDKNNINPTVFTSLCDAHPIDYYITKQMKRKFVITVTLQHGVFSRYEPWIFKNSHSDYFLAYNRMTITEAKNSEYSHNGKMIVLGPPVLIGENRKKFIPKKHYVIGVALMGITNDNQNAVIVDCLKNLTLDYQVRFMIRDHAEIYTDISNIDNAVRDEQETIQDFIDKSDFIVTGNSTVYFEAFSRNTVAFRLKTEQDRYSEINRLYFTNSNELNSLINRYYCDFSKLAEDAIVVGNELIPNFDIKNEYQKFYENIRHKSSISK